MTIGYTRLSLDKYGDHLAVTRQREDIIRLARSLGWPEVTEFYEDNDVSANVDKRRLRPEFERLLRDMHAGRLTHVLCYDQDRLLRDMRQLEDVVEAVEAGRVLLTSVNGDIDLVTDNGRMVARIKAAVARHEIEKMGRRIAREKMQRAQRGIKNGSINRTYGYRRDFSVVSKEAAVLATLFERRAAGEPIPSLVRWLNAARIKSTVGNVGSWNHASVTKLLKRREYIGDVTINGEVVGKAAFPSIIDRSTFEKVNAMFPTAPAPWRAIEEYGLLTGLLVCSICGQKMRRGRGQFSLRNYTCRGHRESVGGMVHLGASVDATVVDAVWSKAVELDKSGTGWPTAQSAAIEREIDQAQRMHANGVLTRAAMAAVVQHLRVRLDEEQITLPEASATGTQRPEGWETWDLEAQRRWLARLVSYIVVDPAANNPPGTHVLYERLTVHFQDGEVRNLARTHVYVADVAQRAGCSTGFASLTLNGHSKPTSETAARVLAAAENLGYQQPVVKRQPRVPLVAHPPDNTHEWLRPAQVADLIGFSIETVYFRLRQGTMRGVRRNHNWWIRADTLTPRDYADHRRRPAG